MTRMTLPLLIGAVLMVSACSGTSEPQLAIMDGPEAELPAWVDENGTLPLDGLTHVADGDGLSAYASRDSSDNWCVVLAVAPTSADPDWVTSANCATAQTFAADGVRVDAAAPSGRHGGAWLMPDNFTGEVAGDWEHIHDNLAIRELERPS